MPGFDKRCLILTVLWIFGGASPSFGQIPSLIDTLSIEPFEGPRGEPPAFAFSLSHRVGSELAERLQAGEMLFVHAEVEAETRSGSYPQVHATIPGVASDIPEVWILAHTNHRNTGGGNNLTGAGASLDVARTLSELIAEGKLARADATQMKRAIVIAAASAYALASAGAEQIPSLAANALAKARARLAEKEHRAFRRVNGSTKESAAEDLWQAENLLRDAYRRETDAIGTLDVFAETEVSRAYLASVATGLGAGEQEARKRLREHVDMMAGLRVGALSCQRRPVGVKPPDSYQSEISRFADAERNLGQIQERVAAEYGLAPLDEIADYFRLLERVGVVSLQRR
jgi:hypothetical protein